MGFVEDHRNAILNKSLNGVDYTDQVTHVSLHTADPGETGASEVSGGSYARQSVNFTTPASGEAENSAELLFEDMPDVTVTHVGLWTASSGGTFISGASAVSSVDFNTGDDAKIIAGGLTVTLSVA